MPGLLMTITNAGLDALVDAEGGGSDDIVIDALGLSDQIFAQAPTLTALPGQFKQLAAISGEAVSDNIVHLTAYDESADVYDVTGFGLFLDDGTLFAVYSSDADPVLSKAELAFALFSQDISFDNSSAANITFGTSIFSYPPASKTKKGVAELADDGEADAGSDDLRIMTPKMVKRRIDAIPSASEAARGLAEIATNAEADAGADDLRIMTSAKVKRRIDAIPLATIATPGLAELATSGEADTGIDNERIMTPAMVKRRIDAIPAATIATPGLAEIATNGEADAGTDDERIMTPAKVKRIINAALPVGIISLWSGAIAAIPSGWALCNGANGTPDLRDCFIVGAGSDFAVGDTGGSDTHGHGGSVSDHTLTVDEIPPHRHLNVIPGIANNALTPGTSLSEQRTAGGDTEYILNSGAGEPTVGQTSSTGDGDPHAHGLTLEDATTLPPYYALAYIMKI